MSFQKNLPIISIILLMLLFESCETSTELKMPIAPSPYMQLHIGDMWQIYDAANYFYTQEEVIDTTHRSDGVKVFVVKKSAVLSDGLYAGIIYSYIKGNYLMQTNLDTTANLKGNKYEEHILAEIFPVNGDYILLTEGLADSLNASFKIRLIDSLTTPCGTFRNVAQYTVTRFVFPYSAFIYYAPNGGYIGSVALIGDEKYNFFITYKKFNGKELGNYIPLPDVLGFSQSKQKYNIDNLKMNDGYNHIQYKRCIK